MNEHTSFTQVLELSLCAVAGTESDAMDREMRLPFNVCDDIFVNSNTMANHNACILPSHPETLKNGHIWVKYSLLQIYLTQIQISLRCVHNYFHFFLYWSETYLVLFAVHKCCIIVCNHNWLLTIHIFTVCQTSTIGWVTKNHFMCIDSHIIWKLTDGKRKLYNKMAFLIPLIHLEYCCNFSFSTSQDLSQDSNREWYNWIVQC